MDRVSRASLTGGYRVRYPLFALDAFYRKVWLLLQFVIVLEVGYRTKAGTISWFTKTIQIALNLLMGRP